MICVICYVCWRVIVATLLRVAYCIHHTLLLETICIQLESIGLYFFVLQPNNLVVTFLSTFLPLFPYSGNSFHECHNKINGKSRISSAQKSTGSPKFWTDHTRKRKEKIWNCIRYTTALRPHDNLLFVRTYRLTRVRVGSAKYRRLICQAVLLPKSVPNLYLTSSQGVSSNTMFAPQFMTFDVYVRRCDYHWWNSRVWIYLMR